MNWNGWDEKHLQPFFMIKENKETEEFRNTLVSNLRKSNQEKIQHFFIRYNTIRGHKNLGPTKRTEHLGVEMKISWWKATNLNALTCGTQCDNHLLQILQNINTSEGKKFGHMGICPSENSQFKSK